MNAEIRPPLHVRWLRLRVNRTVTTWPTLDWRIALVLAAASIFGAAVTLSFSAPFAVALLTLSCAHITIAAADALRLNPDQLTNVERLTVLCAAPTDNDQTGYPVTRHESEQLAARIHNASELDLAIGDIGDSVDEHGAARANIYITSPWYDRFRSDGDNRPVDGRHIVAGIADIHPDPHTAARLLCDAFNNSHAETLLTHARHRNVDDIVAVISAASSPQPFDWDAANELVEHWTTSIADLIDTIAQLGCSRTARGHSQPS